MLSQSTQANAKAPMPFGVMPSSKEASRRCFGTARLYARNAEIFSEGEPAKNIYRVVSGAVRVFRILRDGRRQITAFYLPGDLFGFEAGSSHFSSAEAICDSQILSIKLNAGSFASPASVDGSDEIWPQVRDELRRMQDHMGLLVRGAEERVAYFLLELSQRSGGGDTLHLPMSRQDIADYLGITIETVSRTLTHFEQGGLIALRTSREIDLCRRSALARLNV